MKIHEPEVKQNLIQRLHRIEGQVRGIESMLEAERDCHDILQQLSALHSAVKSSSRVFFQEYATACLLDLDESAASISHEDVRRKREKMIQEMIDLLDKAP